MSETTRRRWRRSWFDRAGAVVMGGVMAGTGERGGHVAIARRDGATTARRRPERRSPLIGLRGGDLIRQPPPRACAIVAAVKPSPPLSRPDVHRLDRVDALRGAAIVWMAA